MPAPPHTSTGATTFYLVSGSQHQLRLVSEVVHRLCIAWAPKSSEDISDLRSKTTHDEEFRRQMVETMCLVREIVFHCISNCGSFWERTALEWLETELTSLIALISTEQLSLHSVNEAPNQANDHDEGRGRHTVEGGQLGPLPDNEIKEIENSAKAYLNCLEHTLRNLSNMFRTVYSAATPTTPFTETSESIDKIPEDEEDRGSSYNRLSPVPLDVDVRAGQSSNDEIHTNDTSFPTHHQHSGQDERHQIVRGGTRAGGSPSSEGDNDAIHTLKRRSSRRRANGITIDFNTLPGHLSRTWQPISLNPYKRELIDARLGRQTGDFGDLEALTGPPQNPTAAAGKSVVEMNIHGYRFRAMRLFEIVRSIPGSQVLYDRVVFEVRVLFKVSPPTSSYVRGTMYRLCSDYAKPPNLQTLPAQSGIPKAGAEAFILKFRTEKDIGGGSFMVDLPVEQIVHVLRQVPPIPRPDGPIEDLPYTLHCRHIHTVMERGQREEFSPIYAGDDSVPSMPARLNVGDFFCGAGGFSEGFRSAGFTVALGVDNNKYAHKSWKRNHPGADCRLLNAEDLLQERGLPEIHIALISPPCQGFSSANPGGMHDDVNRKLFGCVADIARKFTPYWICVENVPGLLHQQNRKYLTKLAIDLLALGYPNISWGVQWASNFGVPQTRPRVILFAARGGLTLPNFPSPTHAWRLNGYLPPVHLYKAIGDLNHTTRADDSWGNPRNIQTWPRAQWDDVGRTVRTRPSDRWPCVHPDGQRLLTVREICRIQTLPATFYLAGTVRERYKQAGNAVPPMLSEAWAREVRAAALTDYPELAPQFVGYNAALNWTETSRDILAPSGAAGRSGFADQPEKALEETETTEKVRTRALEKAPARMKSKQAATTRTTLRSFTTSRSRQRRSDEAQLEGEPGRRNKRVRLS